MLGLRENVIFHKQELNRNFSQIIPFPRGIVLPNLLAHVYIELATDYIVAYRPVASQRPRNK
jgi:hypothetical protein